MAGSKLTLEQRVQALPNELSDAILELVLIPDEPHPIVDRDYKPPVQLQIDRHPRQKFAATYYRKVTFIAQEVTTPVPQRLGLPRTYWQFYKVVLPWIRSLNLEHRQILKHVRLRRDLFVDAISGDILLPPRDVMWSFDDLLGRCGLDPRSMALRSISCNSNHTTDDRQKWTVYPAPFFTQCYAEWDEEE